MAAAIDPAIPKRLSTLNRSNVLARPLPLHLVQADLCKIPTDAALRVINQLEVEAAQVTDAAAFVHEAVAGLLKQGTSADAGKRKNTVKDAAVKKRKIVAAKEEDEFANFDKMDYAGRDFRGAKVEELTEAEQIERHIGWLNRNKDLARPILVEEVLPALDSVGRKQAMRVLSNFEANSLNSPDPDDTIRDMVARSGWIWGSSYIVDEDVRVAKRVAWLNQFGMLQQPINYAEVADQLDGLNVAHAMVLLRDMELQAHKVADPTAFIKKSIAAAGQDDVQLPVVSGDSSVSRRISELNQGGRLAKPIDITELGQSLAQVSNEEAMQLLQEIANKGKGLKDPTGELKFKIKAKLASNGPVLGDAVTTDTKILKRIEWLNDLGGLLQDIDYNKVAVPLESAGLQSAMAILNDVEANKTSIMEPTAYILKGIKHLLMKNASMTAGNDAASFSSDGANFKKLSQFVNFLNNDPRVKTKVKLSDLSSALNTFESDRACRLIEQMQKKGVGLTNPLAHINAAAQRISKVKQENEEGDDVTKISAHLKRLNQSGELAKKIRVNEVVGALYVLGLAQTMEIISSLKEQGSSVEDPTWFIKAEVQRANGVAVTAAPTQPGLEVEEQNDDEDVMDEDAAAGIYTEFPEPEGDELVEFDVGAENENADADNDFGLYAWGADDEADDKVKDDAADAWPEDTDEAKSVTDKKRAQANLPKRVVGSLSGANRGKLVPNRPSWNKDDENVDTPTHQSMPNLAGLAKRKPMPISPQEKLVQVRDYALKSKMELDLGCLKALARLPFYKSKDLIDDTSLGGKDRRGVANPSRYLMMGATKAQGGLGVEQGIAMELAVSLGVVLNNDCLDELASLNRRDAHSIIRELAANEDAQQDTLEHIQNEVLKVRAEVDARPWPLTG